MFFTRKARALAHAQIQWLGFAYQPSDTKLITQVRSRLNGSQISVADESILVTKVGTRTTAVHADYAISHQDSLIVPGVDHMGQQGFLVLNRETSPFYSYATSASEAYAEYKKA